MLSYILLLSPKFYPAINSALVPEARLMGRNSMIVARLPGMDLSAGDYR